MGKKENIETKQNKEIKPPLDWNKWDAIIAVAIVAFIIIVPLGGIEYLNGRFSTYSIFFDACIIGLIVGIFIIVLGILSTVRLLYNWNRYTRKKRVIRTAQIGISILLITIYFLALFIPIQLYSPGYKPFTYGFREQMRSKADVEAIRDWLKRRGKEEPTGDAVRFISYGWPKSVKVLKPRYVNFDLDENGNPKVRLTWGGGFGHWGVEIGMEDMEIPPSDFSQFGEYRLPLEPGVYV